MLQLIVRPALYRTQYSFSRKRYMFSTLFTPISTTLSWNSQALGQLSVST